MKKVLSIILAVALVFGLAACGGPKKGSPEKALDEFFTALKNFDFKEMQKFAVDSTGDVDDVLSDVPEGFVELLKGWAKDIKYTVKEAKTDGDKSTITVDVKYTDAQEVITEAMGDFMGQVMKIAMGGKDVSEDEMMNILVDCIKEASKTKKLTTADTTVDFELKKVDGEWKITDMPDDMMHVMTSNMMKAFEGMGDLF